LDVKWGRAGGPYTIGRTGMRRAIPILLAVALVADSAVAIGQSPAVDETTRLATLARTWGLLKYFHPDVALGTSDWDGALTGAIPRVRALATRTELDAEMARLIRAAGPAPRLAAGAAIDRPEADPAFAWIDDRQVFEPPTIAALKTIRNSQRTAANRYVKSVPNVANPDFSGEAPYASPAFPAVEMRLLALFRFWNMVQYYAPNRDVTDRPWQEVLPALIPLFLQAADANAYHLAVCEMAASINDTHAVTSSSTLSALWGQFIAPFQVRFIESQSVVTRVFDRYLDGADVRAGDVVTHVNGVTTADLRSSKRRYMTASNEGSLQRNLNAYILRGPSLPMTFATTRDGTARQFSINAMALSAWNAEAAALDAAQPKTRMLPGNVGYVNMGRLVVGDVAAMFNEFRNTAAIVFDSRNYPNGTLYAIAERLNPSRVDFVKFTQPRYDQPGTMVSTVVLQAGPAVPTSSHYRGRVLVLADDRTQSQAEFTMMALRTAPDVIFFGTPTSGADGNISAIQLPGGLLTYFSGLGVFYPDGSPTQRVGILPDVVVEPTIRGIANGIDELLERALQSVPR
jgi:carboxyl-terminal processing protease